MTPELISLCTGSTLANAQIYAVPLTDAMALFHIDTPERQAAFLATVGIESARLTSVEESLYYKDADRLASIYPRAFHDADEARPYTCNPAGLGKLLYPGGCWGRGLIQLTWQKNYQAAGEALGKPYLAQPDMVKEPVDAALTAAWFWSANACNKPADALDMTGVTRIVNGARLMHLAERVALYDGGMVALA